jgi:hypothetical protein
MTRPSAPNAAAGQPGTTSLYDRIVEVLHRYECGDEPAGHDWREHLPEDEPVYHPNRVDGLVDLFKRDALDLTDPGTVGELAEALADSPLWSKGWDDSVPPDEYGIKPLVSLGPDYERQASDILTKWREERR